MPGLGRKLVLVDDEVLFLSLLEESLVAVNFHVRTATNVSEARRVIDEFDPDIVMLDISLGDGPSGLHLGHALAQSRPDIGVVFLTKHPDAKSATIDKLDVPAGAGFLRKHLVSDTDALLAAVEDVVRDRAANARHDKSRPANTFEALSPDGRRVLALLADGFNNTAISQHLGMGIKTVERRIIEVYEVLGIQTRGDRNPRVEAASAYLRNLYGESGRP